MRKKNSFSTITAVANGLPVVKSAQHEQKKLRSLQPSWEQWCARHLTTHAPILTHYGDSTLTITCDSALVASSIRNQQIKLLNFFAVAGFNELRQLTIKVQPKIANRAHRPIGQQPPNQLTQAADESLSKLESSTINEELATAIRKLRQTLSKSADVVNTDKANKRVQ